MKNKKLYISIFTLIIFIYLSFYIYKWEFREHVFEINFFSLNRGRAVFIRTPNNRTMLIGGGQNTEAIREITNAMPFYTRKINKVIIPSANVNQIGGLIEIVNRYEIEEIIIPKFIATSTVLNELNKVIRKNKIHTVEVAEGDNIEIESDFKIEVLFPNDKFKYNKTSLPELGLQIKYKNTSAYLIGNLSKTIQKYIAKNIIYTASTSDTQSSIIEFYNTATESKVSKELLDKLKPKFIFSTKEKTMRLISDGEGWVNK